MSSSCWPVDIVSRSRTRIARRLALGSAGAESGKKPSTGSSTVSLPSATARPTAVDVKLLLSEIQHVRLVGRVRRPPAFGDHAARAARA